VFLQTTQINTHLFFVCYQPDAVCSPRQCQAERADTATQLMDSHLGEQAHEYVKNLSYIAVIIFQFHVKFNQKYFLKKFLYYFLEIVRNILPSYWFSYNFKNKRGYHILKCFLIYMYILEPTYLFKKFYSCLSNVFAESGFQMQLLDVVCLSLN